MNENTNESPLRVALLGAGAISNSYSAALEKTQLVQLVAVADTNLEAARNLADKHGAAAFNDLAPMLDEGGFDAVILCTPPALHVEHSTACTKAGYHVMCEKPVSVDSQSARDMIESAAENDLVFTMASKFRFVEDVNKARKLLEQGTIGDLVLFENAFTASVDMTRRWNSNPEVSGGGVLIDNGTHSLDIMRFFLGPLVKIKAVECQRVQDIVVDDTVRVFVESESGVVGNIDLSWSINKGLPNFISLYGSEGTLHVGWQQSKYKRNDDSDWTIFGTGYDKVAAFKNQIENFADAIQRGKPLVVTPADALASVEVVEAAYESMRNSHWESVSGQAKQLGV